MERREGGGHWVDGNVERLNMSEGGLHLCFVLTCLRTQCFAVTKISGTSSTSI